MVSNLLLGRRAKRVYLIKNTYTTDCQECPNRKSSELPLPDTPSKNVVEKNRQGTSGRGWGSVPLGDLVVDDLIGRVARVVGVFVRVGAVPSDDRHQEHQGSGYQCVHRVCRDDFQLQFLDTVSEVFIAPFTVMSFYI